MKKTLLLLSALVLSACSVSEHEVENAFEKFLGESFAGQFNVTDSSYSFAIGDDVYDVELLFTSDGHKHLLSLLENEEKTNFEDGFQFKKFIHLQNGYDFFLLNVRYESEKVRLQYGNE